MFFDCVVTTLPPSPPSQETSQEDSKEDLESIESIPFISEPPKKKSTKRKKASV